MHRITGDGYIVQAGKRLFADEDLPGRYATQVTHEWANAIQEELAAIVEDAGGVLNSHTETVAQMQQVNNVIKGRIESERLGREYGDEALHQTILAVKNVLYPGFCRNVSVNSGSSTDYIVVGGGALAYDSQNQVVMSLLNPISKRLGNFSGYARGTTLSATPQGVTLSAGMNLHIFLLHFSNGPDDVGVDTDINALNLRNDPNCQATHWRRISFCRIESMSSNIAYSFQFGHGPDGWYKPVGPIVYSKATTSNQSFWTPDELCLPENTTGITIIYTVLPPTGSNSKVNVVPRSWHGHNYLTSKNMYMAELAAGPTYRGTNAIQLPYWGGLSNSGMLGWGSSDCTINWVLEGFIDRRNKDG